MKCKKTLHMKEEWPHVLGVTCRAAERCVRMMDVAVMT